MLSKFLMILAFFFNFNRYDDVTFSNLKEQKLFKNKLSTKTIALKPVITFKDKIFFNNITNPIIFIYPILWDMFMCSVLFNFFKISLLNFSITAFPVKQKSIKSTTFFLYGYFDFLKKFKLTFFALFYAFFFLCLLVHNQLSSVQKLFALWFLLGSNIYWLLSTFVFFIKKYYWGKFTTANQRFWKRTLLIFWVIEFFLFGIFLYLTFNANAESYFMLDQLQIYKKFLISIRLFIFNLSFPTLLIFISYFLLLNLKWQIFNKLTLLFLFASNLLGFILFTECYQFFHLINYYSNLFWDYDVDAEVWLLEFESRKTRTHHHYAILLAIIKFWHIIIIVGIWVFFFLRAMEVKRFRYPSLAANLQNFFILYIFNWVVLFPWFKFFCKFLITYTLPQFFLHFRFLGFFFLTSDFLYQILNLNFFFPSNLYFFSSYANIYWYNFFF